MANKRIIDLNTADTLRGDEKFIVDRESWTQTLSGRLLAK